MCRCRSPDVCESVNDTGVVYQAQIVGHKSRVYPYRCRMKPVIQISYRLDPTLTVMLSLVRDNNVTHYSNIQSNSLKRIALGPVYEYPLVRVSIYPCFILYMVTEWDKTNDIHLSGLST